MEKLKFISYSSLSILPFTLWTGNVKAQKENKPNIVLIYADDIGYGDLSCYGFSKIPTPNVDKLASEGIRFTNAHCVAATSTPSRYSLLTGEYAWRLAGTGIAAGAQAPDSSISQMSPFFDARICSARCWYCLSGWGHH